MHCEDRQQALSEFVDGALDPGDAPGLFAHLESCAECRDFLASSLALRRELRVDRDRTLREGDELLPAALPRTARREARFFPVPAGRRGWALAPAAAIALAALLVAAGIGIGRLLPSREPSAPATPPATEAGSPASGAREVVYVCSLPEYPVIATFPAATSK